MFIDNVSPKIQHDLVDNRPAFFNMATCHAYFRMRTFNYEAMVNNTTAFHFVPGCLGENFTKKLRCQEESPVILDIVKDAVMEDDLVKLGIVLHAYADTFSHQGFSGMLSKVNDIKNCEAKTKINMRLLDRVQVILELLGQEEFEKYFDRMMPGYGHCQAVEFPDTPYLTWSYAYDYSDEFNGSLKRVEIDNKVRYQRAFNGIRKIMESFLKRHNQHYDKTIKFNNFEKLMEALVVKGNDKIRERNWQRALITLGLFDKDDRDFYMFQENKWLKEAFVNYDRKTFNNREVEAVQPADNFSDSNWYRFYLAVKWYKQKFFTYCAKYQLSIPE